MKKQEWKITGERIRRRLTRLGMTQKELADATGYPFYTISAWVTGKTLPKVVDFPILAQALNCSSDYLLGIKEYEDKNEGIIRDTLKLLYETGYKDIPKMITTDGIVILGDVLDKQKITSKNLISLMTALFIPSDNIEYIRGLECYNSDEKANYVFMLIMLRLIEDSKLLDTIADKREEICNMYLSDDKKEEEEE